MLIRRVPLAWLNLWENRRRLLASLTGVAFAVVLMLLELGFLHVLYDSHTKVAELLNADLVMMHAQKEALVPSLPFPRRRLVQSRGCDGVQAAWPLYVQEYGAGWKNAAGAEYPILVYGFDPDDPVLLIPEVIEQAPRLHRPDTVLLDRASRPVYGRLVAGVRGELSRRAVHVVGTFSLGPDFRVNGSVLVSDRTFFSLFADPRSPASVAGRVELGLIKVSPGADPLKVRSRLESALPDDVRVLTRPEFIEQIRAFWGASKPVGYVFGLGTALGLLVGVAICYQILYSGILERLPQYATLRAIGYSKAFLVKTVFQEAVLLAVLGFVPGLVISIGLYELLHAASGLPMRVLPERVLLVLGLTVAMCAASGALAVRKAVQSDPAEVFP
jgi:putative ABC transport system permease protein